MMRAVDLFAGAGGFTEGAKAAGVDVLWAANHWREAVEVHARNHPDTEHVCQDLHQADWSRVPEHDLLLASPACQGHSSASQGGRRPFHDASRATAWAVVSCAEFHRPSYLVVENVVQFQRWSLYSTWRQALEVLGYQVTQCVIDAADLGVPQRRQRLFVVASREAPLPNLTLTPQAIPVPASTFLDFDSGDWAPVKLKTSGTRRRVAAGRRKHGARFLTQHVTNHPGRSLERPIGTITTKDQWALVNGDQMRMLSAEEARSAMRFPPSYALPGSRTSAIRMLGNAVCPPVAKWIIDQIKHAPRGQEEA